MVVSGVSMYLGAAVAVHLFTLFAPVTVAWFRVAVAGIILLAVARPRLGTWSGAQWRDAIFYGGATLAMNMAFYQAIATLPLGLVVAIEFLGPVVVALAGSRGLRQVASVIIAGVGVTLISGARLEANPAGLAWALAAAVMWAAYIVASNRISSPSNRQFGGAMGVGFVAASLLTAPFVWLLGGGLRRAVAAGAPASGSIVTSSMITVTVAIIAMGVLSTLVPYALDQVILRLTGRATFAVLLAILPLTATAVGLVGLGQTLTLVELAGVIAIVIALALRGIARPTPPRCD